MAEAIVNARFAGQWRAFSAGTRPAAQVHPMAVRALAEIGIRHEGRPKGMDEFRERTIDLVVTVCDTAAEECPLWLGPGKRLHLGFPDPSKLAGGEDRVLAAFRAVRDDMLRRLPAVLGQ